MGGNFRLRYCPVQPGLGELPARNVAGGIAQKSAASAERNQQLRQSHINQVNLQKRQNWKYFSENWEIYQGLICDFYLKTGVPYVIIRERNATHILLFAKLNTGG